MANYWDGSAWKPMSTAVETGKKRDVSFKRSLNPYNPMGGKANVFMFEGASAPIALGQSPRFCFPATANARGDYIIGMLTVKKNDREVEKFLTDRNNPGGNLLFPANKALGTNVKPLSDRFVEVTPKEPLKEGQYVVANGMLMFDFGVK